MREGAKLNKRDFQEQKINTNEQLGRTLLETLAVLTVIGILSIAGIKIYHYTVNKTKASTTAQMIQTMVLERQHSEGEISRPITRKGPHGDLVLSDSESFPGYFQIAMTVSDKEFCEALKGSILIQPDFMRLNNDLNGTCPGALEFYFKRNRYSDIQATYTDENGQVQFCPDNAKCTSTGWNCMGGYYLTENHCVQCPENSECQGDHFDCNNDYILNSSGVVCIYCPAPAANCDDEGNITTCKEGYYLTEGGCTVCPDENAITCNESGLSTSCKEDYYPLNGSCIIPTYCYSNGDCGDCEQCGASGICETSCTTNQTCTYDFNNPTNPKACYATSDLIEGVYCAYPDGDGNCCDNKGANCCPPDKPIMGKDGICYGCNENVVITVDQRTEKCNRCSNRAYRNATYGYTGWCVPNECPEDKPLRSYKGVCSACGSKVEMRDIVKRTNVETTTCSQCSENSVFDDRFCLVCPNNMIVQDGQCVCSEGFTGYTNNSTSSTTPACFSCGEENLNAFAYNYGNRKDPCSACPNRISVFPQSYYYNYCALATCPSGYMHDNKGNCVSCSASSSITFKPSSLTNSCSECGNLRYTDGNYCKKCPANISGLTAEQQVECTPST